MALTKETALAHAKQCLANPTVQKSHELEGKVARLWAIISELEHRCECDWYKSCDFYNDEEWSIGHCEECKRLHDAVEALKPE